MYSFLFTLMKRQSICLSDKKKHVYVKKKNMSPKLHESKYCPYCCAHIITHIIREDEILISCIQNCEVSFLSSKHISFVQILILENSMAILFRLFHLKNAAGFCVSRVPYTIVLVMYLKQGCNQNTCKDGILRL